jgi:GNAT superfamily N-acetyltransferase
MKVATSIPEFTIRPALKQDVPLILSFIRELAEYEKLSHQVIASEAALERTLFGDRPAGEVIIGEFGDAPVAFALFFHTYSTFLAKSGLYLEDLFVKPDMRGKGLGTIMLSYLAHLARERDCGRFEWSVLDWNEPAIKVYRSIGAVPMDEWTVQRVEGEALVRLADTFAKVAESVL